MGFLSKERKILFANLKLFFLTLNFLNMMNINSLFNNGAGATAAIAESEYDMMVVNWRLEEKRP